MRRSITFSLFASLFLLFFSACASEPEVKSTDIDQIKLELIEESIMPQGISYSIKLKNLSKFTIAQNDVFIKAIDIR